MKKLITILLLSFFAFTLFAIDDTSVTGESSVSSAELFATYLADAQNGNADACYNISLCYQYGYLDIEPDNEKAVYWAHKAADLGVSDAMADLGIYYLSLENDWEKAKQYFEQAAKLKNPVAYYMMGLAYSKEINVNKKLNKGIANLKKASKLGYAQADYQLAFIYYIEKKDNKHAFQYFSKAAEGGIVNAQVQLGIMYDSGIGTAVNKIKSLEWYEKAALQGNIQGMIAYGFELLIGEYLEQDSERGLNYLLYAGENGIPEEKKLAFDTLEFVYEQGIGVEQDSDKASEYHQKSILWTNQINSN